MITFILNDQQIKTALSPGMSLLDFIRYEMDLPGTKIGCREGDCGACSVLLGELIENQIQYHSIVSCLTPLLNVHGKHIVSIEGLNMNRLSPVQKSIVDHGATQCGFCTPGFVVSLTAHCLSGDMTDPLKAIAAIDGNICRCTGYKSIEIAARSIAEMKNNPVDINRVDYLIDNGYLPQYFQDIPNRLRQINTSKTSIYEGGILIGGGTDLMVRRSNEILNSKIISLADKVELKGIRVEGDHSSGGRTSCMIGAMTSTVELMNSKELQSVFPEWESYFRLIASTPIRTMGTLAGNIVNASPIGDLSIIFLALNADLIIKSPEYDNRRLPLREFFLDYKKTDLSDGEYIERVEFKFPGSLAFFNFEKVSKRTHLDIASVNSACMIKLDGNTIREIHLSAGGINPIPTYLHKTVAFLEGKALDANTIRKAACVLKEEIKPISDIRGSKEYKKLLCKQLFFAHFIKSFPERFSLENLTA